MQFRTHSVRKEGRIQPRHVAWTGQVTGELLVREARDDETGRTLRVARITDAGGQDLLPQLHDAVLIEALRGWWSMTGWERVPDAAAGSLRTYQQSWVLIPVAEAE